MPRRVPQHLLAFTGRGEEWARYVADLPATIDSLLGEWNLEVAGSPTNGRCSVVVPVTTADGRAAMLKVGWPHEEAAQEPLALQTWRGVGAVELLDADSDRWALLLERLIPADLDTVDHLHACEIVAGLYRQIHVPSPPGMRRLSAVIEQWVARHTVVKDGLLPRRHLQRAVTDARDLAAESACDGTLIHTDLHQGNVLSASRQPWLGHRPEAPLRRSPLRAGTAAVDPGRLVPPRDVLPRRGPTAVPDAGRGRRLRRGAGPRLGTHPSRGRHHRRGGRERRPRPSVDRRHGRDQRRAAMTARWEARHSWQFS